MTVLNRRRFLAYCAAGAAVASMPLDFALASARFPGDVPLDLLGFAEFAALVGTRFHFYPGASPVKLELAAVNAQPGTEVSGEAPRAFSLIFRGPQRQPLEQDTYPVAHQQLGRFVLFIVPVGRVQAGAGIRFYEAVFNRPSNLST